MAQSLELVSSFPVNGYQQQKEINDSKISKASNFKKALLITAVALAAIALVVGILAVAYPVIPVIAAIGIVSSLAALSIMVSTAFLKTIKKETLEKSMFQKTLGLEILYKSKNNGELKANIEFLRKKAVEYGMQKECYAFYQSLEQKLERSVDAGSNPKVFLEIQEGYIKNLIERFSPQEILAFLKPTTDYKDPETAILRITEFLKLQAKNSDSEIRDFLKKINFSSFSISEAQLPKIEGLREVLDRENIEIDRD